MTNKEKKGIIILIAVATILILIMVLTKGKKEEPANANVQNDTNVEEYVELLDDGTKLNISEKLKETKIVEGLEVGDFQLTEQGNVSLLLGTLTNKTSARQGGFLADIKVIDKQGNEITSMKEVFIPPVESGQSAPLEISMTLDYANAYDIVITRTK